MYVLCVTIHVKPENITSFEAATRECARHSRLEPGNVRYDILQSEEDAACFFIYEAYYNQADFLLHRETPHALAWKNAIEPWMSRPRERIRCNSLIFG